MLPQNLRVLNGLLDDVRRLAMVLPPLPSDITEVFVAVEDARAAALASGNSLAASQLASVSRCLHVSSRNPHEGVRKHLRDPMHAELGLRVSGPTPPAKQRDFSRAFLELLAENGIGVLPLPDTHDETVARAIAKRTPFNDGAKGYRDALVWEAVLAETHRSTAEVVLVTKDGGFCHQTSGHPSKGTQPQAATADDAAKGPQIPWHATLESELRELGLLSRVHLVRSLGAALELLPPDKLPLERPPDEDIAELIEAEAGRFYARVFINTLAVDGIDVTDLTAEAHDGAEVLDVDFVAEHTDGTQSYRAEVDLSCSLVGFTHKSDLYSQSGDRLDVLDWNWNNWVAQVSVEADVKLELMVVLVQKKHGWRISDVDLEVLAVDGNEAGGWE